MSNLSDSVPARSPLEEIVRAALRTAGARGVPVAEVPLLAVAEAAGISRSTLMRRLGGTRRTLDEAVRAAGVDPGGQEPVRVRAATAAAELISAEGLAATTLERVAERAECSVHSLYAAFGGRDELLYEVYERYSPILDVEALLAGPRQGLRDTVRAIYRAMVNAFDNEPRVLPAIIADAFARPTDPAVQAMYGRMFPRIFGASGRWLSEEAAAGRIRDLPLFLLLQQLSGPLFSHFLLRPAAPAIPGAENLPTPEEAIEIFTDTFVRAVALPGAADATGEEAAGVST
ncbi:TetR/AcrR family transcriptional regulator [Streptomyces sp. NPDC001054]